MPRPTSVFELPSAKNYSVDKAVSLFVDTPLFWESLTSDSHDVIVGTRGSGKTLLLRMMSVPHLVRLSKSHQTARDVLSRDKRFGIFLPMGIDWCVAYQDAPDGSHRLFQNGINLVSVDAFIDVVDVLLREKIIDLPDPDSSERELCEGLSDIWFREHRRRIYSFLSLRLFLAQQQSTLKDLWRGTHAPSVDDEVRGGYYFREGPLFMPLEQATRIANRVLGLGEDHRWLLCLDELEDLKPTQKAAIRTALRGSLRTVTLKVTTQPYTWTTATTAFAEEATAIDFRDYELKRLQYDPGNPEYRDLALSILCRRVGRDKSERVPIDLFGNSTFAERAGEARPEFGELRARFGWAENSDSFRKKVPVLAIRWLKRHGEGHRHSRAYSGWDTIVRLSDGNPGVLVRILNEMKIGPEVTRVAPEAQHSVLMNLASSWHEWARALYTNGRFLHGLLGSIGRKLSARLHNRAVRDELVEEETNRLALNLETIHPDLAEALRVGARHALFVAQENGAPLRYPDGEGTWRLAYFLAPKFWLLPRKGRAARIAEGQLSLGFAQRLDPAVDLDVSRDDGADAESL